MTKTSSTTISSELQGDMDEMEETLQGIEKHLEPYFKASLRETKSNLSDLQVAKLNIVIAYSINTLFYMYLKTQGVNPKEHQVMTELDRVRLYIKKIKELTDKENPQKPTLRLNQEAAQRFINHALSAGDPMDSSKGEGDKENDQKKEQDKPTEKKKKEKGKSKDKDKGGKNSEKDKENKAEKHTNKEEAPKSNKRQSPDKVTENTDKKKRRK
eukprot:Phypoly_transcript_16984.p1 GENE.Phypoly_transcript_16984~~Phypoly_transcript_16984.p1  ORF type:complete len:223 (+),score=67.44 Phypoly_transcript_16984:31-669(+)